MAHGRAIPRIGLAFLLALLSTLAIVGRSQRPDPIPVVPKPLAPVEAPSAKVDEARQAAVQAFTPHAPGLRGREGVYGYNSRHFGATFDRGSVAFALSARLPGIGRPRLEYRLASIQVGDQALAGGGPVAPRVDPGESIVRYQRGEVEERYTPRGDEVEQDFVIRSLPAGRGPITVTGSVQTNLTPPAAGSSSTELSFTADGREVLRVAKAVAIDGAGRRLPLNLTWDQGQISMTVPGAWVAEARLPITIDPVVSGPTSIRTYAQLGVTGPMSLSAYNSTDNCWLLSWCEPFGASSQTDLLAQRVSSTGAALGALMTLAATADEEFGPAVSYAPAPINRWLVAWSRSTAAGCRIEAKIVNGNGTLFTTSTFTVDDRTDDDVNPSAAYDGTNWFVCWQNSVPGVSSSKIRGRFVSTGGIPGTQLDPDSASAYALNPQITFANGKYLILYSTGTYPNETVRAKTLTPAGSLSAATTLISGDQIGVQCAGGGNNFLITWLVPGSGVFGTVRNATLGLVKDIFLIDANSDAMPAPVYSSAGNDFYVAYDTWTSTTDDLFGRHVTQTGTVGPAEQLTFGDAASGEGPAKSSLSVAVDATGSKALVAYGRLVMATSTHQVFTLLTSLTNIPPFPPANLAATSGNTTVALSWTASAGATSYKIFRSLTSGSYGPTPIATLAGTSFTDTGLVNGTLYYYIVKATNSFGDSGASNQALAKPSPPPPPPPGAPTNLVATGLQSRVSLTWTGVAGATQYTIYRALSGEPFSFVGTSATTSFVDTTALDGKTYTYVVTATGAGGEGVESISVTVVPNPPASIRVLFVVSTNPIPAGTGDAAVVTRLQNLGFAVDVRADGAATTADATGKALVVISSTVNPANVTTKYRGVAVPVLTWENALYRDIYLGMAGPTAGTHYGTQGTFTQISMVAANASHPLAAGLSGSALSVSSAGGAWAWAVPTAGAVKIATLTTDATKAVIFGYEKGAAMQGLTAPARRVGLFLGDATATTLNANGGKLFDAAVRWATSSPSAPSFVKAVPTGTGMMIEWADVPGALSYKVLRATAAGGPYSVIASGVSMLSFLDATAVLGTTYFYEIIAQNDTGFSAVSLAASASLQAVTYRLYIVGPPALQAQNPNANPAGYFSGTYTATVAKVTTTDGVEALANETALFTYAWSYVLGDRGMVTVPAAGQSVTFTSKTNKGTEFIKCTATKAGVTTESVFPVIVDNRISVYLVFRFPVTSPPSAQTQVPVPPAIAGDLDTDPYTNADIFTFNKDSTPRRRISRAIATKANEILKATGVQILETYDIITGLPDDLRVPLPDDNATTFVNDKFVTDVRITKNGVNRYPMSQSFEHLADQNSHVVNANQTKTYLPVVNVYLMKGIDSKEAADRNHSVLGITHGGKVGERQKLTVILADQLGTGGFDKMGQTLAHELGHVFGQPDIRKPEEAEGVLNNPIHYYGPTSSTGLPTLMMFASNKSNYRILDVQSQDIRDKIQFGSTTNPPVFSINRD
jgi:fibronectin type 3 domain-containing protein